MARPTSGRAYTPNSKKRHLRPSDKTLGFIIRLLFTSYVHVIVDVGVQSALEAVAATPVVVVIVAVAVGPEAVPRTTGRQS